MSYKKVIVVLSGGKNTGLVKLTGELDGVAVVQGSCRADIKSGDARLYLVGNDIAEIKFKGANTEFKMPFCAKNDIVCVLEADGQTLFGSSGNYVDKRNVLSRIDKWKNSKKSDDSSAKAITEAASKPLPSYSEPQKKEESFEEVLDKNAEKERKKQAETPTLGQVAKPIQAAAEPQAKGDKYSKTLLEEGVTFNGSNFYLAVKPQLDEMFVCYPEEKRLNAIVPNSKWVRVDTEGDYYVVGVLFDQNEATYICYGIPGIYNVKPPREISDVCVWLPLKLDERYGDGFWIIYQSADTGKCIK